MSTEELSLLNVFEIQGDEGPRHLIGFLDSVIAGARGLDSRAMVGEFTPDADGEFDPDSFIVNPEFIVAFTGYMNSEPIHSPDVVTSASSLRGEWLYLVDPRNQTPSFEDPPAADVLGCFAVDDTGQLVPGSFQYNENHEWFNSEFGVSALLLDRRFYDWLHTH